MKFKATEQQVRQTLANAVNASEPLIASLFPSVKKDYGPEEMPIFQNGNSEIDYFNGRMVKLSIHKIKDGEYQIKRGDEPRKDYQAWVSKYPTAKDLVESAGAKVI